MSIKTNDHKENEKQNKVFQRQQSKKKEDITNGSECNHE